MQWIPSQKGRILPWSQMEKWGSAGFYLTRKSSSLARRYSRAEASTLLMANMTQNFNQVMGQLDKLEIRFCNRKMIQANESN
jgi:hypothetical protein